MCVSLGASLCGVSFGVPSLCLSVCVYCLLVARLMSRFLPLSACVSLGVSLSVAVCLGLVSERIRVCAARPLQCQRWRPSRTACSPHQVPPPTCFHDKRKMEAHDVARGEPRAGTHCDSRRGGHKQSPAIVEPCPALRQQLSPRVESKREETEADHCAFVLQVRPR